MRMQNEQKTEKHANHQNNAKISSNLNSFNQEVLARGVGFEPTRPLLSLMTIWLATSMIHLRL
jgi:hypothetical protein